MTIFDAYRALAPVQIIEVDTPRGASDLVVESLAGVLQARLRAESVYPLNVQVGGTTKFCVVMRDLISEPFTPGTPSGAELFPIEKLADGWVPVAVDDLGEVVELPLYTPGQGGVRILIAGSSGSGKSTVPNNVLASALRSAAYDVWLADPQMQTFGAYEPYVTRSASTVEDIIQMVVDLDTLKDSRVDQYMADGDDCFQAPKHGKPIILVLEELSAMTDTNPDKKSRAVFEAAFTSLAQRARKAGITLVVSMQVSSADTIPSRARSQFDIRVAHQLATPSDTGMILPSMPPGAPQPHEIVGSIGRDGLRTSAGLFILGGESVDRVRRCRGWHIPKTEFVSRFLAPPPASPSDEG
ncbi:hypothetical protein nbrc107696_42650 [Gordonia spumicola]|uniref:FtsK domain-containing protein n=1 Tax=Gordonia spumicola TaxID=589161 RepID=A0A7I9VEM4_9ACTN|nr:hypothetical protein [Gordonia spumicola]GEE03819.1 hypothetical protein nbrc107696_42650 [Gordonia spumicola]